MVFTDPFQMCELFSYCWWLKKKSWTSLQTNYRNIRNAIFIWQHDRFFLLLITFKGIYSYSRKMCKKGKENQPLYSKLMSTKKKFFPKSYQWCTYEDWILYTSTSSYNVSKDLCCTTLLYKLYEHYQAGYWNQTGSTVMHPLTLKQ